MLQVITAMFRVEAVCDHRFRNMNSNRFRKIILVVLLLLPFGEVQDLIPNPPQQLNIGPPGSFIAVRFEARGDDVVVRLKIGERFINTNTEDQCFISQPGSADGLVETILCFQIDSSLSTVTLVAQSGVHTENQTIDITRLVPPTDLRANVISDSAILFNWTAPLIPTGIVFNYHLYFEDVTTGNPVTNVTVTPFRISANNSHSSPTTCEECLLHWTNNLNLMMPLAPAPNNIFLFEKPPNLDPSHTYSLQVTTGSLAGESERSESVLWRFQDDMSENPDTTPNKDPPLTAILVPALIIFAAIVIVLAIFWCYRSRTRATGGSEPDTSESKGNSNDEEDQPGSTQRPSQPQCPQEEIPLEPTEQATQETGGTTTRPAVVIGQTVPRHRQTPTSSSERDIGVPNEDGEKTLPPPERRFPDPELSLTKFEEAETQGCSASERNSQIPEQDSGETTMEDYKLAIVVTASCEGANKEFNIHDGKSAPVYI